MNNNNETPTLIDLVGLTEFYNKLTENIIPIAKDTDLVRLLSKNDGIFIGFVAYLSDPVNVIVSFKKGDSRVYSVNGIYKTTLDSTYDYVGIFLKLKIDSSAMWGSD